MRVFELRALLHHRVFPEQCVYLSYGVCRVFVRVCVCVCVSCIYVHIYVYAIYRARVLAHVHTDEHRACFTQGVTRDISPLPVLPWPHGRHTLDSGRVMARKKAKRSRLSKVEGS